MTTTTLDVTEINSWLGRLAQLIDRSLRDAFRQEAIAELQEGLEGTTVGLNLLAQLALLDDCLRVAHLAIEADGLIDDDEVANVTDLVRVAAPKYFAVLPFYESFGDPLSSRAEVERFLRAQRRDVGPFGSASKREWRGLELVRRVEKQTRNAMPLREHERMLARIMDHVFGGRATDVERAARRRLRDLFEPATASDPGLDPRAVAFCRADGPEVFSSVMHGSQIHERDPFDIESIHVEARSIFDTQVERATTPVQASGHGRTLLILGDSGSGKTHLLRALRAQVHGTGRGYVGYLQMTSDVGDYSRYVLRNLIDSLEKPYDPPAHSETGLTYLSEGLAEGRAEIPAADLEVLRSAELSSSELDSVIGRMIDRILRTDGLGELEPDLLHALLLLQRNDAALYRRIVKFLRCEALGAHDRALLGGLAARDQPEDPQRTLRQLAKIMYELQLASLVLLVDQIEDTIPDGQTVTRMQQAFDSLRAVADGIPSSVVVIAGLTDVYDTVRPRLSQSLVDRLERDPTPIRLTDQIEAHEIEQMLVRRLEFLYSGFEVTWREDEPLYPFAPHHLAPLENFRARAVLARFREHHAACIAARSVSPLTGIASAPARVEPASKPRDPERADANVERLWNDSLVAATGLPEDDDGILGLVQEGIQLTAAELGVGFSVKRERGGGAISLVVEAPQLKRRVVAVCNRQSQGGHLGNALDAWRGRVKEGTPYLVRSSEWKFRAKTRVLEQYASFIQAGGRAVVISERDLRAISAARSLLATKPELLPWFRSVRPLAQLELMRQLLDLDRVATPMLLVASVPPPVAVVLPPGPQPSRISAPIPTFDPDTVRLGVTTTMRAEPVRVPLEQVKTHLAFLGTTGSGKTTAALGVAEQLLERGVSVLLVDRKGDLARYADEAWWQAPGPDRDRRVALRERIDVALYTPGNSQGRPLRLPLLPPLHDASLQDREQLAKFAANGLATMMGYGTSTTHRHKVSILLCAIRLHAAEQREITIELLSDTIDRPDPELLQTVGGLQRFFAPLSEDLQSLRIQRGSLIAGDGDVLDVGAMLPTTGARARLSIISTSAMTEIPVLQFWISRLLVELARLARKRPSQTLQAAAFFDEADAYIPAMGNPATKEPMFDLLRRARSGGIGVLLASQNPGDFDYKARDLIGTWLVGKVGQDRAIEKMRNLLGNYPNVAARLASQATGNFFILTSTQVVEVKCDRALMNTEQLSEQQILALAQQSR